MDLTFSFLLKSKGFEVLMLPILFVLNYSWTLLHLRKLKFWKFLKVAFCSKKQLIHTSFFCIKSFIVASDNYLYHSSLTDEKVYITQQSSFLYLFLNLGCGSLFFIRLEMEIAGAGRGWVRERARRVFLMFATYLCLQISWLLIQSFLVYLCSAAQPLLEHICIKPKYSVRYKVTSGREANVFRGETRQRKGKIERKRMTCLQLAN